MAECPAETPLLEVEAVPRQAYAVNAAVPAASPTQELTAFSQEQGYILAELPAESAPAWSLVAYKYMRSVALNLPLSERARTVTLPEPLVTKHLQKFWEVHAATGTDTVRQQRLERAIQHQKFIVKAAVGAGKPFPELKLVQQLYQEAETGGNPSVLLGLQAVLSAYGMTLRTLGFMQAARMHRLPQS